MNAIFRILNHRYSYHIYFWSLLFMIFVFVGSDRFQNLYYGFRLSFAFIFPWMIATYTHFFIHSRFFNKRRYLIYILLIIPLILIFGYLSELSVDKILFENQFERSGFGDVAIVLVFTTGLRYFRRGITQQYRMQEMEAKQLKAELNLLKSQVNPHFLFNTLNNLFSIAQKNNDNETAHGLLKLSQIMRYLIYENSAELVSLEKEIAHIKDYIELQKLRFENQELLNINFRISGNFKSIFICPMILIPFIENAFKHGLGIDNHSLIDIELRIENKLLNLKVKNAISNLRIENENNNPGIGLENVKKRLILLYPDRHILLIESGKEFFYIDLKIEI